MSTSRQYTFSNVVRFLAGAAVLGCAVWLVNLLKDVLLPFCVACLISYFLEPLVRLNRRWIRCRRRAPAVLVTLLEVAVLVGAVCYFCVPSVVGEITRMAELLKKYSASDASIPFIPDDLHSWLRRAFDASSLSKELSAHSLGSIFDTGSSIVSAALHFVMHTVEWLLTFIYVIFILLDYPRLMTGFRLLVPPKYRSVAYRVSDDIRDSMNRYFRGQALIALCAAVFYSVGFSIVGIPLAIVLGVLVGVLYMIPYFQYVTLIPVALVCMISAMSGEVEFWPELGKCLLVYLVSQCVCDYVLTPKIMGKALGLNPAIILLSLSVWGTLLGLIGMIIALPMTTLCLAYYQEYVIDRHAAAPDHPKDTPQ